MYLTKAYSIKSQNRKLSISTRKAGNQKEHEAISNFSALIIIITNYSNMQLTAEITNYTNMQLKAETPTPPTSSNIHH
jgi:hypothetical protein